MVVPEKNLPSLRCCRLFSQHTETELKEICEFLEEERHKSRGVIFSEGDIGDCLYVLVEGEVHLSQTIISDKKIIRSLGTLGPGLFFGEMALIDQTARSATATAVKDIRLLVLSRTVLNENLDRGNSAISKILREISRTLSLRVRTLEDILSDLFTGVYMLNKDSSIFPMEMTLSDMIQHNRRILMEVIREIAQRDEINRMKNEFVAMASHELRTPLTSIRGSLGLLVSGVFGALPDEIGNLITVAHKNTERLIKLVNDMLDIEKIESGVVNLDIKNIGLDILVNRAIDEMTGLANEQGVVLKSEVPGIYLMGDFDRTLQVIDNLVSNAIRFSPKNGEVLVKAQPGRGFVKISVSDNGPGIPAAFRGLVFQKFQRADTALSREKSGTGLGLAICKAIVEAHRGKIWFESEEGRGTTFFFTLPTADEKKYTLAEDGQNSK